MNLMLLLAGLAHAQDAEPIVRTLPTSAPELRLLAGRSDVSVRHSTSGKSRVVVTPIRWSEVCEVRFSGDASVAVAQVFEDGEESAWRCAARFDVELAGPTAVSVEMNRARVDLDQPPGPVTVRLGRGSVSGTADALDAEIRGPGRIALWDLAQPVRARVGAGSVSLAYAQDADGAIAAEAGWGRVKVSLPYGSLIDDQSETTVGMTRSDVPARAGHATQLQARTTVGNVRVVTDLAALSVALRAEAPDQTTADASGM